MTNLTMTDLFCGAGGSSTGAVSVPGVTVRLAANHWATAIETHNANHPDTDHLQADISNTDPRYIPGTDILWASPECTNHSRAKGRKLPSQPDLFGDVEHHRVEWTNYLTPQALIDLVASRSYCITSPEQVRTRTLERVRELLSTHPALANTNGLALPYLTVCTRATLT